MHEGGGNCLKYLKRGWNRKEWRGHKDFKLGEQVGSRGAWVASKGEEGWNPLTNYDEKVTISHTMIKTTFLNR